MFSLRRAVTVCVAAAALAVAGAPAAPAASFPAVGGHPPPGDEHYHHHNERPANFGPFEVPHRGDINGGVGWEFAGRRG